MPPSRFTSVSARATPVVRIAALALALAAPAAAAQGIAPAGAAPRAACTTSRGNGRVLVHLALTDFFDRELLRLVRLGLVGRLTIDVAVVRARRFWFDSRMTAPPREVVVQFDSDAGAFRREDGTALPDPNRIFLDRQSVWLDGGAEAGRGVGLTVEVTARLQVVTAASLAKVATWLAGGRAAERERSVLSRSILRTLASDFTRSAATTCAVADR